MEWLSWSVAVAAEVVAIVIMEWCDPLFINKPYLINTFGLGINMLMMSCAASLFPLVFSLSFSCWTALDVVQSAWMASSFVYGSCLDVCLWERVCALAFIPFTNVVLFSLLSLSNQTSIYLASNADETMPKPISSFSLFYINRFLNDVRSSDFSSYSIFLFSHWVANDLSLIKLMWMDCIASISKSTILL